MTLKTLIQDYLRERDWLAAQFGASPYVWPDEVWMRWIRHSIEILEWKRDLGEDEGDTP